MGYTSGLPTNAQASNLQHWAIIEPSTDNRNQRLRPFHASFEGYSTSLVIRITALVVRLNGAKNQSLAQ
jgi:hypothetical protein